MTTDFTTVNLGSTAVLDRDDAAPVPAVRGLPLAPWMLPAGIAIVAMIAFAPAVLNGFVRWDDLVLFSDNPRYRGLGWAQVRWMFTTFTMGHWVPLTWLTHGLDYVLWGMNPAGYHAVNVALHAVNAVLFWCVARRLLRKATSLRDSALDVAAATAALFFALHPLRAESVAWITERRDVLSGAFFFLTVLLHLRAVEAEPARRRTLRLASLACFVLAFLAKSMVMTLPFVLVVLDVYPLGRLGSVRRSWREAATRAIWVEKLPYLAITVVGGTVAFFAQKSFFTPVAKVGWTARPLIACYGLWFYVSKTVVPTSLSPLYQLPEHISVRDPLFVVPLVGVLAITALTWTLRRRWPAGLALWVAYGVMIAPVSGLVHAGFQLAHDRYSYLPCVGWALLVGAGAGTVVAMREGGRLRAPLAALVGLTGAAWLVALSVLTWQQVHIWRDTENLWRYAVESEPRCALCQGNLGVFLSNEGHFALALPYFERAIALRPSEPKHHRDAGLMLLNLGRVPEATAELTRAVELAPTDVEALNTLGVALIDQGRYRDALAMLEHAASIKHDDAMVETNLGTALLELGRLDESRARLEKLVARVPQAPRPHLALGMTYARLGKLDAARAQYDKLAALEPRLAPLLGAALIQEW